MYIYFYIYIYTYIYINICIGLQSIIRILMYSYLNLKYMCNIYLQNHFHKYFCKC